MFNPTEALNRPEQIFLNFNASKIRWLSDSKITPTNLFCIGSGENSRKFSLWLADQSSDKFEPRILWESNDLDGECTELKTKNSEEIFISTSNGSIYGYKYSAYDQKLVQMNRWSKPLDSNTDNFINAFDLNSDGDELCYVKENGTINFIKLHQTTEQYYSLASNELCSLNSVLYLKQFETAVADSLGRIKIWDTRSRESKKSSMTLALDGECSSIICMAKHPNQQHIIACGNANGLLFIYDVRSQKKPFVMSHTNSAPVLEVCFHPLSAENLLSCSFDGSLWYWNASSKGQFSNWDDRLINAKNFLPNNRYTVNSFDINNENIIAVNNNYGVFKIKNAQFI